MDLQLNLKTNFTALIIADLNDRASVVGARNVMQSIRNTKSTIIPFLIQATTPQTLEEDLKTFGLSKADWTYPKVPNQTKIDIKSGMHLTGYNAKDLDKVISCTVSHMRVWYMSAMLNETICVLEHDAVFTRQLVTKTTDEFDSAGIIGLNDPRGATRKASVYLDRVISGQRKTTKEGTLTYVDAPWIDNNRNAPQGIAGNSAYIISPSAARALLRKVDEMGLWPNDALMCKQFLPYLKQAYPFYTTVQGIKSTTTS